MICLGRGCCKSMVASLVPMRVPILAVVLVSFRLCQNVMATKSSK